MSANTIERSASSLDLSIKEVTPQDPSTALNLELKETIPQEAKIGAPENASTTAEIEVERDAEQAKNKQERIAELEQSLAESRNALAYVGSKRSMRMRSGKTSKMTYEILHGNYTKDMQELGRLKLETEHADLDDNSRKTEVIKYIIEEQNKLRAETTDYLQGTPVGKLVKWLNKEGDSRLKSFAKLATVGLVGGAAIAGITAATGGIAGGAAMGLGLGAGFRAFRGFVTGQKKHGRSHEQLEGSELDGYAAGKDAQEVLDHKDFSKRTLELNEEQIEKRQSGVRWSLGRGALYASAGGLLGALLHYGTGLASAEPGAGHGQPGVGDHPSPSAADHADQQTIARAATDRFTYHSNENPFYRAKAGIHDMGGALRPNPELDGARPAGFDDLVNNRWIDSPEQFSSIYSAMHVNGAPDDMYAINSLAEHFKVNPHDMQSSHAEVMKIINDPSTRIHTEQITHPYSSEYGVDMGHGDVKLGWDDYVDEGGTKTVIEYTDPATGARKILELRNDCGGQRIVEHPDMPVAQETVYEEQQWSASPTYYDQTMPSGGGNYIPSTGHHSTPPSGHGSPPPGGHMPPGHETPHGNDAKNGAEDWQRNPKVADWKKDSGPLFDSGTLKPATEPGQTYTAPTPAHDLPATDPVPGAASNADTDPHAGGSATGNTPDAQPGTSGSGSGAGSVSSVEGTRRSDGNIGE